MLELLSAKRKSLLLSFSTMKKLAFLILLYDRMLPELRSYFLASGRDFVRHSDGAQRGSGDCCLGDANVRFLERAEGEQLLDSLPDSEDDSGLRRRNLL